MQTTTEWTLSKMELWNRRHVNEKLAEITKSRKEQKMKKIINGKKYDTETAREVACKAWGYYGDLNFVFETLYKKKTGEFFLYGEGGANTSYVAPPRGVRGLKLRLLHAVRFPRQCQWSPRRRQALFARPESVHPYL